MMSNAGVRQPMWGLSHVGFINFHSPAHGCDRGKSCGDRNAPKKGELGERLTAAQLHQEWNTGQFLAFSSIEATKTEF